MTGEEDVTPVSITTIRTREKKPARHPVWLQQTLHGVRRIPKGDYADSACAFIDVSSIADRQRNVARHHLARKFAWLLYAQQEYMRAALT